MSSISKHIFEMNNDGDYSNYCKINQTLPGDLQNLTNMMRRFQYTSKRGKFSLKEITFFNKINNIDEEIIEEIITTKNQRHASQFTIERGTYDLKYFLQNINKKVCIFNYYYKLYIYKRHPLKFTIKVNI